MRTIQAGRSSCINLVLILTFALFSSACGNFFVSGNALNSITLSPTSIFLKVGETEQFTASGKTVNGDSKDVTASAKWTSSSPTFASVNAGLVTALAAGNTTITASQDGVSATSGVIVNTVALTSITITPSSPTVAAGSTTALTATGTFEDNSTQPLTNQVAWSSSDTTLATVSTAGVVTGIAFGSPSITATVNTSTGTITKSVTVSVQ
ncbi:MAG: Ig-like domain-containing protein [Acidobacteriaceae bacterium]